MILDERGEFADDVSLNTGAAATYNIGDIVDLSVANRDIGVSGEIYLVVQASRDITVAAGSGTVQFQLVSDGTSTIATDGSQSVHARSASFPTSTTAIKAGTTLMAMALPMEGTAYERYLAVQQVTGTTAINAGGINAFLTKDVSRFKAYAAPFHP